MENIIKLEENLSNETNSTINVLFNTVGDNWLLTFIVTFFLGIILTYILMKLKNPINNFFVILKDKFRRVDSLCHNLHPFVVEKVTPTR